MASQITTNPKPVNDVSPLTSTANGASFQRIVETILICDCKKEETENDVYKE